MKRTLITLFVFAATALAAQTLDNTFNGNGIVKTEFSRYPDAMASLSEGKTAVASQDWGSGSIYLIKYNEDGSIDQSFGVGGVATHVLSGKEMSGRLYLKALEGDRLLVTGCYGVPGMPMARLFAARFNADGSIDQSFGVSGLAVNDTTIYDWGGPCQSPSGQMYASYRGGVAEVDYAGRIVQGGTRTYKCDQEYENQFYAVRYSSEGAIDGSFHFEPIGFNYTLHDSEVKEVHIASDSAIFLIGHGRGYGDDTIRRVPKIMYLEKDGTTGFDLALSMKIADASVESFEVAGFGVVDSGYLLAGTIREGGRDKFAVTKIRKNIMQLPLYLNVDSSFGNYGRTVIDVSQTYAELSSLVALNDGKVLLGGSAETNPIVGTDMVMARLDEAGSIDQSFGSSGVLKIDHDSGSDYLFSLQPSSEGKMVALGSTEKSGELNIVLMRYADGLTSIAEAEASSMLKAYPNPAHTSIAVEGVGGKWTVTDAVGREVMEGFCEVETAFTIDVSGLQAGVYFVQSSRSGQGTFARFAKQ